MAGNIDASSIGVGKTYETSQDAVNATNGKYADNTAGLTEDQRLPKLPQAPAPTPFTNMRNAGS